jgi:hypothetical protein
MGLSKDDVLTVEQGSEIFFFVSAWLSFLTQPTGKGQFHYLCGVDRSVDEEWK